MMYYQNRQKGPEGRDMEDRLNQDLKQAMLAKDATRVSVIRSIKSALIYAKVAPGATKDPEGAMSDETVLSIIAKEAKKRQESADMYVQGASQERADAELQEKTVIEKYLPKQLDETEVKTVIEEVISGMGEVSTAQMGQIIGAVKSKTGASADGALIARLVKERLS